MTYHHDPDLQPAPATVAAPDFAALEARVAARTPEHTAERQARLDSQDVGLAAMALGEQHLAAGDLATARMWFEMAAAHQAIAAPERLATIAVLADAIGDTTTAAADTPLAANAREPHQDRDAAVERADAAAQLVLAAQTHADRIVAAAEQHAASIIAAAQTEADAIAGRARAETDQHRHVREYLVADLLPLLHGDRSTGDVAGRGGLRARELYYRFLSAWQHRIADQVRAVSAARPTNRAPDPKEIALTVLHECRLRQETVGDGSPRALAAATLLGRPTEEEVSSERYQLAMGLLTAVLYMEPTSTVHWFTSLHPVAVDNDGATVLWLP
ncbi:hypothetical protein [Kutzneria sp. NPDC052558]|uniref:hypothetical protein n=1 Tax=Kutzneria sp. NPDC052558 TaxID=3364121 RepID=UPI0037C96B57